MAEQLAVGVGHGAWRVDGLEELDAGGGHRRQATEGDATAQQDGRDFPGPADRELELAGPVRRQTRRRPARLPIPQAPGAPLGKQGYDPRLPTLTWNH